MFQRRISRQREKVQRPQRGLPKSRGSPFIEKKKICNQFLRQVGDDVFDLILVHPKSPPPRKGPEQKRPDSPRFEFQPMATSTPKRKKECLIADTSELSAEERFTLGQRLTMSQFIGTLPKQCDNAVGSEGNVEGIAVNLPNFLHNDGKDFEEIILEDVSDDDIQMDAVDLNKTQNLFNNAHIEDPGALVDGPFSINDSTRFIFKEIFQETARHGRKLSFKPSRAELRAREIVKQPKMRGELWDFLLAESKPPKETVFLKGLQFDLDELRELYDFLKILFAEADDRDRAWLCVSPEIDC